MAPTHTYLQAGEVARLLGVSPKTVARWSSEGKLPCSKTLGGHRRYDGKVIAALVEHLTRGEQI